MLKTLTVKINSNTNKALEELAQKNSLTKSAIIRNAIDYYIQKSTLSAGASLVKMAKEARNYEYEAPADIIQNLDDYIYEIK